ncbi:hypothetical protein OIU84_029927 [Salix udensis]|uniref:Uncharacterized protein n=1 Tax=Salix udensis TaxID=889485 RepID=A0AAD6KAE5_9ROSI|nr:hypothetical protein OIU84_029927 [Salix udensis]
MTCLDMYNSERKGYCPPMSPRISFSNDFADSQQIIRQERSSRETPVSSDFEFSVTNYSMMSADELFFKGRLLPFKDSGSSQMQRTIRDELLVDDDKDDQVSQRPRKGFFYKVERAPGSEREATLVPRKLIRSVKGLWRDQLEIVSEGGSSCRDVEIGM